MSSVESLSDTDMTGMEQLQGNDRMSKRLREDSEGEWSTVGQRDKRLKDGEKVEIYITCNEKLPKQFSLAKIFKEQNITNIIRVKYLNPYKVRVDLTSEVSAEKLEKCQKFIDMNWRIQKALEKSYSYGIIKDIDLEITNDEILNKITCPHTAQLVAVSRLNRRNLNEYGWIPCETVRLCFKGSFVPAYVNVDDMRIKVEKYVFPVSQCSRCWKYGHTIKKCPSSKIVCPKCGKNHANCETEEFNCINCSGKHMALSKKVCPVFLKEKKLRDLMAEFNCTYRKALEMYVQPDEPIQEKNREQEERIVDEEFPALNETSMNTCDVPYESQNTVSFSDVTKKKSTGKNKQAKNINYTMRSRRCAEYRDTQFTEDSNHANFEEKQALPNEDKRDFDVVQLLRRVKEIIFMRVTIKAKIIGVIKCCIEWFLLSVVDNLEDWPILRAFIEYLNVNDYG